LLGILNSKLSLCHLKEFLFGGIDLHQLDPVPHAGEYRSSRLVSYQYVPSTSRLTIDIVEIC
jgi:hypothetical protein